MGSRFLRGDSKRGDKMEEEPVKPMDVILVMQKVKGKWWTVGELSAHCGVFEPVMIYMLNRLMQQHLLVRKIGSFSNKTYYKVKLY